MGLNAWQSVLAALGILILLLIAGLLVVQAGLPDPNRVQIRSGEIRLLDRSQKLIETISGGEIRQVVPLEQVSPLLQAATVSAEDRHFFEHRGIDWGRLLKAMTVDVVARRAAQGASTITQQLAKVDLLGGGTAKRNLTRKISEALLATEIEQRFSKQDILRLYLNAIYYGHHAYGSEAAARVYFDKPAKELDLAEASFLAGLPQAPSYYNPQTNFDAARAKQRYVLDQMARDSDAGLLKPLGVTVTRAQADAAFAVDLKPRLKYKAEAATGPAPHFAEYVQTQLVNLYGKEQIYNGSGVTVTTSLDLDKQLAANRAVQSGVAKLTSFGVNNAALVVLDEHASTRGQVLVMVGSADFNNVGIAGQVNIATTPRQPGSSFKPYVYASGITQRKLDTLTVFDDSAEQSAHLGGVKDFDNRFEGRMTLRTALVESRNVPAEQAMVMAGVGAVINTAHELGINTPLQPNPTTAIGSSEVTMLDHATGYGVFATLGFKHDPVAVLKVLNADGQDITVQPNNAQQVLDAPTAFIISDVLKGYNAQWHLGFDRPMAAKSGTTNRGTSTADGWLMAYNPDVVIATWAGHTSNDPGAGPETRNFFGIYAGQQITAPFLHAAFTGNAWADDFHPPPGLARAACPLDPAVKAIQQPSGGEWVLAGDAAAQCSHPSPTAGPSPSPSASSSPSPSPSGPAEPSPGGGLFTPRPQPTPTPRPSPTPSQRPSPTPAPSPT